MTVSKIGVMLALSALLWGCASAPERDTDDGADRDAPVTLADDVFDDPMFDGVYIVPGVDFSRYERLLVTELNLDQWRPEGRELPLQELNRNDQNFFRQQYTSAIVHHLMARGGYELSLDPGRDVLRVDARLRQSVQQPLTASREAPRGTIVMVLTLELLDSATGQMVATMTSRQPIDRSMNERNSPVTAMQVSRAFSEWMQWFRDELDELREEETGR